MIGILAYGSLIRDPGVEITPLIHVRLRVETPFPVEFGRFSRSRGGGPTVVPHEFGQPVAAEVLVLREGELLSDAEDMLWRRETRQEKTGRRYNPAGASSSSVLVKDAAGFRGLVHVLYTDFLPTGKIATPNPHDLAIAAVQSVKKAEAGKDGISYLMDLMACGIETRLMAQYVTEVLRLTKAENLAQALTSVRPPEPPIS